MSALFSKLTQLQKRLTRPKDEQPGGAPPFSPRRRENQWPVEYTLQRTIETSQLWREY